MKPTPIIFKKKLAIIMLVVMYSCNDVTDNQIQTDSESTLFTLVNPSNTNITFENTIKEDSKFNFINYPYIYNGGGVAVGDIDNDGLPDVYFSSNQESNRLYLNKGNFKFEDISKKAKVKDDSGWSTGTTMVDINNDGFLDIYVCKSGVVGDDMLRKNKLYINQQNNTFKEDAKSYGLDHTGFSTQAYFFDFDLDNDLDMYLVNHRKDFKNSSILKKKRSLRFKPNESDQLFRNDGGVFTNITQEAGIANDAWGLSASIGDFNNDSLPDIYVANDFISPDFLYINKGNGTFVNEISSRFKHLSYNSMGSDYADINNDLQPDLVVLDMMAEDHIRGKENMATMDTRFFWALVGAGYHYQYMSNTLQLNDGNGTFSEIAQLSGVAKTDWSWAPLIADFDNDGYNDLFITNGIENDLTNQDFRNQMKSILKSNQKLKLKKAIGMMPSNKLSNYIFRNNQNLTFENKTKDWGLHKEINSNGAVYVDLDRDGDLDLVVNNQSDKASVYKNNSKNNTISFAFKGPANNLKGIGTAITIYSKKTKQKKQLYTSRGYQSSVEDRLSFGVNDVIELDSAVVHWPDGLKQKIVNLKTNTNYVIEYKNAVAAFAEMNAGKKKFTQINADSLGITYKQKETIYNDYKLQLLLPQKQSEIGTPLIVADVNNDGLDDFFVGNAKGAKGALYIQKKNGTFKTTNLALFENDKIFEDTNALFIDVDNDNNLDLYVTSGGYEIATNSALLQDRLYLNDGKGNFVKDKNLPVMLSNTKAISTADFDNDGDQDLFIGGRVKHGKYPLSDSSYLLENQDGIFKDVTETRIKDLSHIKMVNDVLFTDFDNDKDYDLIVVGEWMQVVLLENEQNEFVSVKNSTLDGLNGWFQSITATDVDQDGFTDYLIGNWGLNNKFHPSKEKPLHIYADYLDDNETFDVVLSKVSKTGSLLPIRGKECSTEQVPGLDKKINSYSEFASLTLPDIYGKEKLNNATHYEAHTFNTFLLKNRGGKKFEIIDLPNEVQMGPTLTSIFTDVNNDNLIDIIGVGNVYEAEVETIRYDASKGYVLLQKKDGSFEYSIDFSGFTGQESTAIEKIIIRGKTHYIVLNKNAKLQILN